MLKSIQLTNFLSFGGDAAPVELRPLNVLIGPNGSGKSNFIEAIELLKAAPKGLRQPIRDGGGVEDWLWKGAPNASSAIIDAVIENIDGKIPLRYVLGFNGDQQQRFQIADERIENEEPYAGGYNEPVFHYRYQNGKPVIRALKQPEPEEATAIAEGNRDRKTFNRHLKHEAIDHAASILSQRGDPDYYPELAYVGDRLGKIRIYREWAFGRYTTPRTPQKADLPGDYLEPDGSNLGVVLNSLRQKPAVKKRLLEMLRVLYAGIDDFDIRIEGDRVQVVFQEGNHMIPGTRLSDGTLRYLCLLTILCHPDPGPLVCIEEPELGLHPDVLTDLAKLMIEVAASKRTQLIVTTHSDMLVSAFDDKPESVLVVERTEKGTEMERLNPQELKVWLKEYRLGDLWMSGEIGGTRW